MSAAQREFDIVLYGATGFAGKLTAQYLAKAGGDARIALAGRSQDKLLAVRETLGEKAQSWQLITADASQPSTLNAMAAQTQVVVTTVGPYTRYGLPLVAACAAAGTDYADLTGESDVHPRKHRPLSQAGRRHRCAHRAFVRIRFHPFGSHRVSRCTGGPSRTTPASSATPTWWCARSRAGYPAGTVASMMELMRTASADPEAQAGDARPVHADA